MPDGANAHRSVKDALLDVHEPDEIEVWPHLVGIKIPLEELGQRLRATPGTSPLWLPSTSLAIPSRRRRRPAARADNPEHWPAGRVPWAAADPGGQGFGTVYIVQRPFPPGGGAAHSYSDFTSSSFGSFSQIR
jgi:hypothetical protein